MATTTYNLTGVFGTQITVIVEHNDNNATSVDMRILAVSDDAPDFFVDALNIEEDFIIARCFDGEARDGDQWALALDDDGTLTHEAHAFNPQYVETFTINVKEH